MAETSDGRIGYTGLVALVAFVRIAELLWSRRNVRRLQSRGGFESGARHYPFMVAVHVGFLASCLTEVWLIGRPLVPALAASMAVLLAGTFALRYWVIATLGDRWTTRIIVVPREPLIATGPFRWLRHPNYLGVFLEFPALALVHTAWMSALVFGSLNALVLLVRIRVEDRAWSMERERPDASDK